MSTRKTTTGRTAFVAVLAAAALGLPLAGTAYAETTPAPSPTTSAPATTSTETSTETSTPTSATETSTSPTTTAPPTTSTTSPTTSTSSTSTPAPLLAPAPLPAPTTTSTSTRGLVPGGTSTTFGPAALPGAPASINPAMSAASFLVRELAAGGGHFVYDGTDYADIGLTIDAILGLDAAGVGQTQAAASTKYVADNVVNYIAGGDPRELYAGPTAKTLVLAEAQGIDPTAFGGVNLVASLQSLETDEGRFSDNSEWGDYSNTFGQSFAVIGLHRAGAGPSAAAVNYLAAQQCTDGGFRLFLGPAGGECVSDPDATSMALQGLIAVRGASDPAVQKGLNYLVAIQDADGGVGGGGPTSDPNANSTGLAAQAFALGGRAAPLAAARSYLASLQFTCFQANLNGAIAYNPDAYDEIISEGSDAEVIDQDRRSTAQALLGFAGLSYATVSAQDAYASAPAAACTVPTTTPTKTATASTTTASTTTDSTTAEVTEVAEAGSGDGGNLANTGSSLGTVTIGGFLLALLGVLMLFVARTRER